jgi:eukaryotic-like serine/threonine-protein kinase
MDLSVGTAMRFTFDPADDYSPIWAPDGSRIAFASNHDGTFGIYEKLANGSGDEEQLLSSAADIAPRSWSADGRFIVFRSLGKKRTTEVWVLPLIGDRKPIALLQSDDFYQSGPMLSPDGRWMAVYSNESGRYEVYIHSFQKPASKWQVSTKGGIDVAWSHDGKELFYLGFDGQLMAVAVKGDSALDVGTPRALFETHMLGATRIIMGFRNQYDVAPDGQRFLLNVPVWEESSSPINVVLNWPSLLKK